MGDVNNGGPAFPAPQFAVHESVDQQKILQLGQAQGMTLRQWLAGMAMQGLLSDMDTRTSLSNSADINGVSFAQEVAMQAFDHADAMIAESNKS